jgi:hypothetical protein
MRPGLSEAPAPALALGLAGAAPFVAGALAIVIGPPWLKATAYVHLVNYAAVVLAFTGAVQWGLAIAAGMRGPAGWRWYAAGAVPALLAWAALALVPPTASLLVLAAGYAVAFAVDLRAVAGGLAPDWYRALRKLLTAVAVVCLGVALAAVRATSP